MLSKLEHAARQRIALDAAESGGGATPALALCPDRALLTALGRQMARRGLALEKRAPTEAASRHLRASLLLARAGCGPEAEEQRQAALAAVRYAVGTGMPVSALAGAARWQHDEIAVEAPARIDLGGGWSDTPPFCQDWGGSVLNIAIEFGGRAPIRVRARRLGEPVVRCICDGARHTFRNDGELLSRMAPGSPFAIAAAAAHRLARLLDDPLPRALRRLGGGVEIETEVDLPMGSGLGASSILAAAVIRAVAALAGVRIDDAGLCDETLRLEQTLATGGGWQDQAGAIFPGAKLITSAPGLRQALEARPLAWSPERQREFARRVVLLYTGVPRLAKDLLERVVFRYLAREPAVLAALHRIKALAGEMARAMELGDWSGLGELLDLHWQLNQVLNPRTTNARLDALIRELRPYLAGAKLAGAGGGGFLILLAASPERATAIRERMAARGPGPVMPFAFHIAGEGLRIVQR